MAFTEVLKQDIDALKEDMLRDEVDPLVAKAKILAIRQVMNRLTSLIDDLEENDESARSQGGRYTPA